MITITIKIGAEKDRDGILVNASAERSRSSIPEEEAVLLSTEQRFARIVGRGVSNAIFQTKDLLSSDYDAFISLSDQIASEEKQG